MIENVAGHTFFSSEISAISVVLDLRANRGRFSSEIIDRFHYRSYAVEANPRLCELIRTEPRLKVLNYAVAGKSGKVPFQICGNCESSTILSIELSDVIDTIEVAAITLDELISCERLEHVDLIKFDIEGAEIPVLDSCLTNY
jgi:FkbM family methyltransferase